MDFPPPGGDVAESQKEPAAQMPIYTFYFCKADGSATTFEAHLLDGDDAARTYAEVLARQHPSCAYVALFEADREVPAPPGAQPAKGAIVIAKTRVDPAILARVLNDYAILNPSVAVIATTLDGAVAYWNAAAARLYGWAEEEAVGRNILDLTPALQSRGQADEIMRQLRTGQPWSREIILRTRRGAPFEAFVTDVPVGIEGDNGLIVGVSARLRHRKVVQACQASLVRDLDRAFGG